MKRQSLIAMPTFSLGRFAATAALGGIEISHAFKQYQIFML